MSGDCRREPVASAAGVEFVRPSSPTDESLACGPRASRRDPIRAATAIHVHGVAGNLAEVRGRELAAAARILGVADLTPRDYPDGALDQYVAAARSAKLIEGVGADGLLAFDPSGVTGHRDHAAASAAALLAAADLHLPVLGWTLPDLVATQLNRESGSGFVAHAAVDIDIELPVIRTRQVAASVAHLSQAIPARVVAAPGIGSSAPRTSPSTRSSPPSGLPKCPCHSAAPRTKPV